MKNCNSLASELIDLSFLLVEQIKQDLKTTTGGKTPTLTQFKILYMIRGGLCHVGKLADVFGISQPATSKMIDALVTDGFLKRAQHPTDRRQIQLHLTKKATVSFESILKDTQNKIDMRLSALSITKRTALAKQIHEIALLLGKTEASK